jgi:UDP-3-O-[3-hydroxymyristoyl] glucosamine N-acyltransferase
MQISIADLAQMVQGTFEGDGTQMLNTIAKIQEGTTGALSFFANPKYENHIYTTQSSAVLVNKTFVPSKAYNTVLIRVEDAYATFTNLLEQYGNTAIHLTGIEQMSFIDETAVVGENAYVGAFTYISKNVKVGENTKLFPHVFLGANVKVGKNCIFYSGVKIYHDCIIGDNCILHSGTVIGGDGFGFSLLPDGSYKKIPQIGNVIMESDVEIGANCTIDRATMGSTHIRKGVKFDNLIQIAHNAEVGDHTVIAGQAGVAGSTKIGRYNVIGGQAAFAGHLTIADYNQFGGQCGVVGSIKEENGKWFGTPVLGVRDALRSASLFKRLPELLIRIDTLEKEIKSLKKE